MAQRLNEYLELEARRIRCRKCGTDLCAGDQNYKLWVLQSRSGVDDLPGVDDPSVYGLRQPLELRRYYCPGCCVQLEVEVSLPDLPPLWDIEIDAAASAD
jgi:acetone carboxylase gamma subunit